MERATGSWGDAPHSADGEWIPEGCGLERHYADVCGFRMSYVAGGQGDQAVVLLHGLGSDSSTWSRILPELAQHYRVYAPDMFGCGRSDKPAIAYTVEAMAHYVRRFMDAVGIPRAHLIGHSLGGGVAMQTLYFSADRIERVVLVDSGGLGREVHWLLRASTLPGAHWVIGLLASPHVGVAAAAGKLERWRRGGGNADYAPMIPPVLERLREQQTRRSFLRMIRAVGDFTGQTVSALSLLPERAGTPILLIWGEKDRIIPVSHAYKASTILPGSHIAVISNSHHQPHLEFPAECGRLMLDFLQAPSWPADDPSRGAFAPSRLAEHSQRRMWQWIATLVVVGTGLPAGFAVYRSAGRRRRGPLAAAP